MGKLIGISGQYAGSEFFFDASGTINTGGVPQLILPKGRSRSSFVIENNSAENMYFEFGAARATATLSSGVVSSISVTNVGFGYSLPPHIEFLGGQNLQQTMPSYSLQGSADFISPSHPAKAHCIMTGTAGSQTISSIVIDDHGAGYAYPPYVFIHNDPRDPFGCADPSLGPTGILLEQYGAYTSNSSVCCTDQIAVYCETTGAAFMCKYTV